MKDNFTKTSGDKTGDFMLLSDMLTVIENLVRYQFLHHSSGLGSVQVPRMVTLQSFLPTFGSKIIKKLLLMSLVHDQLTSSIFQMKFIIDISDTIT